jgi:ABC-type transporter Mla MlaB component
MLAKMRLSPEANRLLVALDGDLDLSADRVFKSVADLGRASRCQCVLDLGGVQRILQSGFALLLVLRRRLGDDSRLRLINCDPSLRPELERLGIEVD